MLPTFLLLLTLSQARLYEEDEPKQLRKLMMMKKGSMMRSSSSRNRYQSYVYNSRGNSVYSGRYNPPKPARETSYIRLKITNLSFQQFLSPFFVATHNTLAPSLFTLGSPASPELARLAEDGKLTPTNIECFLSGGSFFEYMNDVTTLLTP